jgi:hypothetical protein
MLNEAARKAPLGELVDIMDVGWTCAYLASPFAHRVTAARFTSTAVPTSLSDQTKARAFCKGTHVEYSSHQCRILQH